MGITGSGGRTYPEFGHKKRLLWAGAKWRWSAVTVLLSASWSTQLNGMIQGANGSYQFVITPCDCDGNVFDQCGICGGDDSTCGGCTISTLVTTMKTLSTMMELASSWIAMVIAVERRFWMRVAFATDQAPFTSVVVKTFQWEIAIATATSWMLVAFVEEMARLALVAPTRRHATMTKLRPLTMAHA